MNPLLLLLGLTGTAGLSALLKELGRDGTKAGSKTETDGKPDDTGDDTLVGDDTPTGDTGSGGDTGGDTGGGDTTTGGDRDTMTGGGGDTTTGGGGDTMTGGDHDTMTGDHDHDPAPALAPPGIGASETDIAQYLSDLAQLADTHSHDAGSAKAMEHMAAMDLVPRAAATHVAIGDGDWFDPATWANGEVPGDDARVLIPDGVTVHYEGVSDARLFTVRVDGKLEFATDADSQMIFDTFVVSATGHLEIGTAADPVHPDVDIDLIVANNGPIDTDWDPMLLSRGLISHGETTIYGAEKDSHEKVIENPMEGDTSIRFDGVPEGWQVGDTIVIAATHYEGFVKDPVTREPIFQGNQDEVRVITSIDDDGTVHFDDPLIFNHDSPREDLFTSVANYTRNVSIETENADTAEIFERGHVMFMHSDGVDVHYAEFHELGRTDKSFDSFQADDFDPATYDSNVQGRYALHLHRSGTEDLNDPAILEGNAVYGSPGWGIVHHDSNAILINNATFDTFGAGFVAETGNETGLWADNIAIFAEGNGDGIPKLSSEIGEDIFDTARGGEGFWFQGRLVASVDNVAASVTTGFAYFHRDGDDRMINFDVSTYAYPAAHYFETEEKADDTPILNFDGNESFAAREGLHVVKGNPMQGHDVQSHLTDFTAWNVINGAHLQYTAHYILEDFDVIGVGIVNHEYNTGIVLGANTSEITIIDPKIDNFEIGIDFLKHFTRSEWTEDMHHFTVIDPSITNTDITYLNYDPTLDTVTTRAALPGLKPDLQLDPLVYDYNAEGFPLAQITGTKTDSLGKNDFPNGTDTYAIQKDHMVTMLEDKGYWTTSDGKEYVLVDIYLTDRLTAEVFYETHAVFIDPAIPLGGGDYRGAVHNGVQDIVTSGGQTWAGDVQLDVAVPAVIEGGFDHAGFLESIANGTLEAMHDVMHAMVPEMEDMIAPDDMASMSADDSLAAIEAWITDSVEFGDGEALVLAGSDARIGLTGETAILDFDPGSAVMFIADENGLGQIIEPETDEGDTISGIDIDGATLEIDLSGLDAAAGEAFTLMEADEIAGIFSDAIVGGLGARNATIVVDYQSDSVKLVLSDGTGQISVRTLGDGEAVPENEALWDTLTADHGVADDEMLPEDELLDEVA